MTIGAAEKNVGMMLLVLQNTNGVFRTIVEKNLNKLSCLDVLIKCSKSRKTT